MALSVKKYSSGFTGLLITGLLITGILLVLNQSNHAKKIQSSLHYSKDTGCNGCNQKHTDLHFSTVDNYHYPHNI